VIDQEIGERHDVGHLAHAELYAAVLWGTQLDETGHYQPIDLQ
jgi:hypothetical protein